jgi:hypothetical protein
VTNPFKYFIENFGKEPEPGPPLIPEPWRIPFFVAVCITSLLALALVVYFVVIPGMQAEQAAPPASVSVPAQ